MKIKLLFFFILFLTPTLSFAETKDELFSLIKQRLQYAEDVALYKFNNSKPISDLQREEIILSSSRGLAEKYNLDPKSLQNFIQSQINANKSIQYRNFANWMSSPPTPKNINLEK